MQFDINEKYRVTSDQYCYKLNEVKIVKSGENKGEEVLRPVSYHRTLKCLMNNYLEREVKTSDVVGLNQIVELIKEVKLEVENVLGKLEEVGV